MDAMKIAEAPGMGPHPSAWFAALARPVAWFVNLEVVYALAPRSCIAGSRASLHLCTLAALGIAILSAVLFWWAVMEGKGRSHAAGYGLAVLYLFTTALHSGLLGALITLASSAWYPAYARTAPSWGLSALEDQQLGGLIMWAPACVVYIVAGLALLAVWLRESERSAMRREVEAASLAAAPGSTVWRGAELP